jgi:hypothetical protein
MECWSVGCESGKNIAYIFSLLHHSNTPDTIYLRLFIEITSYLHMIYAIARLNILASSS